MAIDYTTYQRVHKPKLGIKYHVSWAPMGVVGVCVKILDGKVWLMRPKQKTLFKNPIPFGDLVHLRNTSIKILKLGYEVVERSSIPDKKWLKYVLRYNDVKI